tara:strand:+ start:931 stop:1443 length:513 start_codon:yes stop_codon:yes gene_type:complete
MEQEFFDSLEKGPIVGIFGDTIFPNRSLGEGIREKAKVIMEMKFLLSKIQPKKVYVIPHKGVNLTVLTILQCLNIPYTIVNPYKGYFNSVAPKDKIKVLLGMENSSAIVTMGNPPKHVKDSVKALSETEDFIIDRSDLIITITSAKPSPLQKKLNSKLPDTGKHILFIKY